jgi:hypothetical protein
MSTAPLESVEVDASDASEVAKDDDDEEEVSAASREAAAELIAAPMGSSDKWVS